jgi:hypothetical protein
MSYFPQSTGIPEELFNSILSYLHPGAVWLFCRGVSRTWKNHVDANIERYIHRYATIAQRNRIPPHEVKFEWDGGRHVPVGLELGTLYVEIVGRQDGRDEIESCFVMLKFKKIDLPTNGRGSHDTAKITFETENNAGPMIWDDASRLEILKIDNFMFPGFQPRASVLGVIACDKPGTHNAHWGHYEVKYTCAPAFVPHKMLALTIHQITIPVCHVLKFEERHVARRRPWALLPEWSEWREYVSPIFARPEEEREWTLCRPGRRCQQCYASLVADDRDMGICPKCQEEADQAESILEGCTVDILRFLTAFAASDSDGPAETAQSTLNESSFLSTVYS